MEDSMHTILGNRFNKDEIVGYLQKNPEQFDLTFNLALENEYPQSWRAAWVVNHCIEKNDRRIQPFISTIMEVLNQKQDGHQRELLKILENATIPEDLEGELFDLCVTIWGSVEKSPSVRIVAFRTIVQIVSKYPELKNEIDFLTQDHYLDSLSAGIRNSCQKQINKLNRIT